MNAHTHTPTHPQTHSLAQLVTKHPIYSHTNTHTRTHTHTPQRCVFRGSDWRQGDYAICKLRNTQY